MGLISSSGINIGLISAEKFMAIIRIAMLLLVGIPFVYVLSKYVRAFFTKRLADQPGMIAGKIVYYSGIFIIFFSTLNELGFNLNTLLGAAGIIGIAVGFASQTSVSNVISGIFLMLERPFVINDVIALDDISGQVMSIDMLSVKLKTEDNRYIRIPNENIIKTKLTNITRFPTRRVDIRFCIAFKEDISQVRTLLIGIAARNEYCLRDPEPQVILTGIGPSSVDMIFAMWATQQNYQTLKNMVVEEMNKQFGEKGIETPLYRVSLYQGKGQDSHSVQIVGRELAQKNEN
jgi:small-conductance mechanosensitive channel